MARSPHQKRLKLSHYHEQVRRANFVEPIPVQAHFKERLQTIAKLIEARPGAMLPVNNEHQYKTNASRGRYTKIFTFAQEVKRGIRLGYFKLTRQSDGSGRKSQSYLIRTQKPF